MPNIAEAYIGSKATLSFWDLSASPDAWTRYEEVRKMDALGAMANEVDKTTLDSDAVERRAGLPDPEKFGFTVNMTADQFTVLLAQRTAGTNLDLKADYTPTGLDTTLYFTFVPLGLKVLDIDAKGLIECKVDGRVSGEITETPSHS